MWMSSTCHTTFSPVNFEKLNTDQCIKELKAVCFNSFPFILCSCTHAIFAVWVSIKQYYCGWAGCEEVECAWGTDRLHQSHSSGQKYPLKCYNKLFILLGFAFLLHGNFYMKHVEECFSCFSNTEKWLHLQLRNVWKSDATFFWVFDLNNSWGNSKFCGNWTHKHAS